MSQVEIGSGALPAQPTPILGRGTVRAAAALLDDLPDTATSLPDPSE